MNPHPSTLPPLERLARLHGLQTEYIDAAHCRRRVAPSTLKALLRSLGVNVDNPAEIRNRLRSDTLQDRLTPMQPVHVAWENQPARLHWNPTEHDESRPFRARLRLESGRTTDWTRRFAAATRRGTFQAGEVRVLRRQIQLPRLPTGYHHLELECASGRYRTMIIVAPVRAWSPEHASRDWGVFLPLYALHSRSSWGGGDWADLERLCRWTAGLGGRVVSTLPMLPAYLDRPFDPSPYAPVSRLFWNEFYLNLNRIPELRRCPQALKLIRSRPLQLEMDSLRQEPLVEYRRQMRLKRTVLETLARHFFTGGSNARRDAFERYRKTHPHLERYAAFRATMETRNQVWSKWPQRLQGGILRHGDYRRDAFHYHLYVQWLAHEQVTRVARTADRRGIRLYLDMPLGVRADGFDAWQERDLFAFDASGGAPPDPVFTRGQDWGFPPLHPRKLREQHYRYAIATLRHHLRQARMLRLDHAMNLHRLYWVPRGFPASAGAYVHYHLEEWCAILCLESHRHRAVLVGENLGTVPPEVNAAMNRHHFRELFVVQYEQKPSPARALRPVPRHSVASLNTHDMPAFAAYERQLDLEDRHDLGLLSSAALKTESKKRKRLQRALREYLHRRRLLPRDADEAAFLEALLVHLARSPAETLLVNLEDLWLETAPQNVPATSVERVNWRRKSRLSLEQIKRSRHIRAILARLIRA